MTYDAQPCAIWRTADAERCRSANAIWADGGPERPPYRPPEYAAKHDSVSHSFTSTTGKPCPAA